jgi:hypothetical protein
METENILGLIAGQGRLPFLIADGAKKAGLKVICVGLGDNADPGLKDCTDKFFTGALTRPGWWMRKLRKHGASRTVMVGRVAKTTMYTPFRFVRYIPDWRALRIWFWRLRKKDKQNDTVLCAIADELASGQIYLEDSTMYCKDHLATQGVMTKTQPPAAIVDDIEFGWNIVKKMGELDIGQAVAIREKEVIAVEAIEGTAEMVIRAGKLCRRGNWTLIKTAKPNQDLRFDVPCIGVDTVKGVAEARGKCIVVEAGKTIVIDKPETIALADKLGIAIVGH